ncbi:MAG: hypothetical protein KF901_32125 [Myxococcales bacterium]|nr:hypothetical protein [Myxococcales bacterium]
MTLEESIEELCRSRRLTPTAQRVLVDALGELARVVRHDIRDDMVQTVLLKLVRRARSGSLEIESARAYLRRMLVNAEKDVGRKEARAHRAMDDVRILIEEVEAATLESAAMPVDPRKSIERWAFALLDEALAHSRRADPAEWRGSLREVLSLACDEESMEDLVRHRGDVRPSTLHKRHQRIRNALVLEVERQFEAGELDGETRERWISAIEALRRCQRAPASGVCEEETT